MMARLAAPLIIVALLLCAGCGKQRPTYAEAVQMYTADMLELSRLQAEREKVEQSYETRLKEASQPDKDFNFSKQNLDWLKTGTTEELVNKAMQALEYTQWYNERVKRGAQLKDPVAETEAINAERKRLGLPIEPGIAPEAASQEGVLKMARDRDEVLAKIDKEIAEQKSRVDRDKALRDQSESHLR